MEWITIVSLLAFGILLLVVEIVLVPGTTLVGLLGVILMGVGVWMGFRDLGLTYGYWLLGLSIALTTLAVYVGLKRKTWHRFSLTTVNKGRVNEDEQNQLPVGSVGKTLSSLRPIGTGYFNGKQFEVQTRGEFIQTGMQLRVIHSEPHHIIVEKVV
ncbi:MAG TPA: hypothetical protein VK927_00115 [Adhaeribacter sp.]|nr:hypothetical protein [Adhaeribacter sp.]